MSEELNVDEQAIKDALEQMEVLTKKREAYQALKGCASFVVMVLVLMWFLAINSVVGYLVYQGL